MIETHPLQPYLPKNAKLLMLGSFPPPQNKWKIDFYYPNYQNDMWRIMGLIFFKDKNYFLDLANKSFDLPRIQTFLNDKGIAIFDTAYQVKRLQNNAADKFLEVVIPSDIPKILQQLPNCQYIMTTGDKATDTLLTHFPTDTIKPKIGCPSTGLILNRTLQLYRMPSSSRAYPLALEKKAQSYEELFKQIGFI